MTTRVIIGVVIMLFGASLPASECKREETPGRSRTEFDGRGVIEPQRAERDPNGPARAYSGWPGAFPLFGRVFSR